MDPQFAEAFLHTTHRCMGRRLHPFTLSHAFLLDLIESPILSGGEHSFHDLYRAVQICSRPPLDPSDFRAVSRAIAPPRGLESFRYGWRQGAARSHHLRDLAAFSIYLSDFNAPPRAWDSTGEGVKVPWFFYLAARLIHHAHLSRAEAWATVVGEAHWWSVALSESSGKEINIIGAAELAALQEAGYDL
jgi:hypothetical protein